MDPHWGPRNEKSKIFGRSGDNVFIRAIKSDFFGEK